MNPIKCFLIICGIFILLYTPASELIDLLHLNHLNLLREESVYHASINLFIDLFFPLRFLYTIYLLLKRQTPVVCIANGRVTIKRSKATTGITRRDD